MSKGSSKNSTSRARVVNGEHEMVAVGDLTTHPGNPRRGDLASVKASIEVNGFYGTIVAQRSTGYVLAGNHRLMAARELGMSEVPVVWVDCDDTRARAILAADNRTSELGGFDKEALATLLEGLRIEDALEGVGYDEGDITRLLSELEPEDDWSPEDEWVGMPDYEQEDLNAKYTLKINFETLDDKLDFGRLIGQTLTEATKSVWHPKHEKDEVVDLRWVGDDEEE